MSLIRPFKALRPVPSCAADLLAPPYDVLNSEEARQRVADRPHSFLHVSKPEIDLPAGIDPFSDQVYRTGRENLQLLINDGLLQRDPIPHYYVYQLEMGAHRQTGLVAVASVQAYNSNRIRRHEFTRPDKEQDRVRHVDTLGAQTGPVFLVYRADEQLDQLLTAATEQPPEVDVTLNDGVVHRFWVVRDQACQEQITALVDAMEALYIADGHHRSAAAARVAEQRGEACEGAGYFLSVLFSDAAVQIFDYNRVITDLQGLTAAEFVDAVAEIFELQPEATQVRPGASGEFGMYLEGQWYRLKVPASKIPAEDPVARLDVSLLHGLLIEPVLGISDPRRDKRVDFVGGIRGLDELERRVDSGEMAVAFSLYPTTLEALMSVADAGEVMPPKSTWFEPKLADGMASHVLD